MYDDAAFLIKFPTIQSIVVVALSYLCLFFIASLVASDYLGVGHYILIVGLFLLMAFLLLVASMLISVFDVLAWLMFTVVLCGIGFVLTYDVLLYNLIVTDSLTAMVFSALTSILLYWKIATPAGNYSMYQNKQSKYKKYQDKVRVCIFLGLLPLIFIYLYVSVFYILEVYAESHLSYWDSLSEYLRDRSNTFVFFYDVLRSFLLPDFFRK